MSIKLNKKIIESAGSLWSVSIVKYSGVLEVNFLRAIIQENIKFIENEYGEFHMILGIFETFEGACKFRHSIKETIKSQKV